MQTIFLLYKLICCVDYPYVCIDARVQTIRNLLRKIDLVYNSFYIQFIHARINSLLCCPKAKLVNALIMWMRVLNLETWFFTPP